MSEQSEVRPEVVEAIVGVLKGGDPADLPPGATAAEKAAAKDTYLSDFVAERGKRDRQSQAWELLLNRSYDESPSWKQIFDDLDPSTHEELGHPLRRPAGRRPGGVRAPLRGPLRRLSPPAVPMTRPVTTPGRLVAGRYRLRSQLGGGGMGTVWLARDELLGREVAIKQILSPHGVAAAEADQQRQRALREGRIAARLSHPHAISVYDVALEAGQPWLVMEYLPSRSLATVLAEDGVLRVDQVAQIGAQVADALAATHAAGIVHRDVKPANILIGAGRPDRGPGQDHRLRHLARQRRHHADADRTDHRDARHSWPPRWRRAGR